MDQEVKVIVLGRNYTSRLGMIRAAGMSGHEVLVINTGISKGSDIFDKESKYVRGYFFSKEPDREGLVKVLKEKCTGPVKNIIIPTDDYSASTIDLYQKELEDQFLFPNIDHEPGKIAGYMNKGFQKELAEKAGFDVAKGWTAVFDGEAFSVPEDVTFPCFVKPRISVEGSKNYMKKCNSKEELTAHLESVAKKLVKKEVKTDLLIEEFIEIEQEYAVLGFCDGTRAFIPDVIKAGPMHMGVMVQGTVMSIDGFDGLREKLEKMMASTRFCGLFDIDLYESKGKFYFCEINFRFGASGYAVTHAGINLPGLLIDHLLGKEIDLEKIPSLPTLSFVSEKVCYQEYRDWSMSWKKIREKIKNADFTFVNWEEDPEPGKTFWRFFRMFRIKRLVKKLIGRK